MDELCTLSVRQIRAGYAQGAFSPVEVVEACLDRISAVNPILNAHWYVAEEQARSAARDAAARWLDGSARVLEGIPIGIKDTIDVAGMPCTLGSLDHADRVPLRDAAVVTRLKDAGAIVVTKDATSEFAFGSPFNPLLGFTGNPWRPSNWAGGSSTGGAAGVSARCLPAAIGTDAGGSVRAPAAWSGITGLKPTKGRVSRVGVMSLSWTMCSVGPLTRTARDAGLLLSVIGGYDEGDPQSVPAPVEQWQDASEDLSGVRIGVPWDWAGRDADSTQGDALAAAAEQLGAAGAEVVALPTPRFSQSVGRIGYQVLQTEAAHGVSMQWSHDRLDPWVLEQATRGRFVSAASYLRALDYRAAVQRELAGLLDGVDVLMVPTTIGTAPEPDGAGGVRMAVNGRSLPVGAGKSPWTVTFNLAGLPAIAVPAGLSHGLPVSIQLVASPFQERACIRVAAGFQRLTTYHESLPPVGPPRPSGDLPTASSRVAAPSTPSPDFDLESLAQWFGEKVSPGLLSELRPSLEHAWQDMQLLQDHRQPRDSGLCDPAAGDAFLRRYLSVYDEQLARDA